MRADDARNLMNTSNAMNYIQQACIQGKQSVSIPIEYVNREHLQSLGYKISGGTHQRAETCTVSWEKHWRD